MDCTYTTNGCNGGWPATAMNHLKNNGGSYLEANYTYTSGKTKTWGNCTNSSLYAGDKTYPPVSVKSISKTREAHIAALQNGMIAVALRANHNLFMNYKNGTMDNSDLCNNFTRVDHAVVMLGFVDNGGVGDYFVLKNSWGTGWGEKGYFRVAKECSLGLYNNTSS